MARVKLEIDWKDVQNRVEAGCSGLEIAAHLHVKPDTFYNRFREEFGERFQDLSKTFYECGNANIRYTQYIKALSGNVPMLILLGRERLGQGKIDDDLKSPYEDMLSLRHDNMILRAEIEELKEKINNGDQS